MFQYNCSCFHDDFNLKNYFRKIQLKIFIKKKSKLYNGPCKYIKSLYATSIINYSWIILWYYFFLHFQSSIWYNLIYYIHHIYHIYFLYANAIGICVGNLAYNIKLYYFLLTYIRYEEKRYICLSFCYFQLLYKMICMWSNFFIFSHL